MKQPDITIYYDTKTGNVARFIKKLCDIHPEWHFININDFEHFSEPGHLITFTWARGSAPVTTQYFVERFSNLILSVSSSGNRNWGPTFGMAADIISKNIGCPIFHKFELSGLKEDVQTIAGKIKNSHFIKHRKNIIRL